MGHGKEFHLFTKYVASIGKLVKDWREHLSEFINMWETIHGPKQPAEKVNYRRCPLRLVSGRWGSIHGAETFLLQRGRKFLQPVLLAMFSRRMKAQKQEEPDLENQPQPANASSKSKAGSKAKSKAKAKSRNKKKNAKTDPAEALLDDDSRATYNIKMTKWASGACQAVMSSLFWLLLEISQMVRAPLTHFFCWCQSLPAKQRPGIMIQLVTSKAQAIMDEFRHALQTLDDNFARAVESADAQDLPPELLDLTKAMSFKLILRGASDFHMRVVQPTQRYPLKLLWLKLVHVHECFLFCFHYLVDLDLCMTR